MSTQPKPRIASPRESGGILTAPLTAPLRTAVAISSPPIRRRALIGAALVFVERMLGPLAAFLLLLRAAVPSLVIAAAASALFAVRGTIQRSFVARNEAELYRAAVSAVLHGDVLEPTLLPDHEARISLFQALNRVASLLAETLPELAGSMLAVLLLSVGVSLVEAPQVTLVAAAAVLVGAAVLFAARRWTERAQDEAWAAWEPVAERVTDACDGRLELAAAGRVDQFLDRFALATRQWETRARQARRTSSFMGRLPLAVLAVAVGGAVVLRARAEGLDWTGAVLRAAVLATCTPAFFGVARGMQDLTSNAPRLRLVHTVFASTQKATTGGSGLASRPSVVEWRGVQFAYRAADKLVLRGVSFVWKRGELLVLSGPNGSGKSTCLRVALGLGPLRGGQVLVDGVPLSELDGAQLRRTIALLPQRPYLPMAASVRQALAFLDVDVTEDRMRSALSRVRLLTKLAASDNDPLAASVGRLSAGERQRLAIARLLCSDAPLILLDEPDANLDPAGVELVCGIVRELSEERMVLVVAHSRELADTADRAILIENGSVQARGH